MSLIGDIVMALPVLDVLRARHPDAHVIWSIADKCKQCAPLFENDPRIQEIKISDLEENLGDKDRRLIETCDLVINPRPIHTMEWDWYNHRGCVAETAIMAGFDPRDVEGIKPTLFQHWTSHPSSRAIAIFPFAGYGRGLERSPSVRWWQVAIQELLDLGYKVYHFGAQIEPMLSGSSNYHRSVILPFVSQIEMALDCDLAIGTDSGSMWCVGAYHKIPQINLLTNWLQSHNRNHFALAPEGNKTHNLFAEGSCSNIPVDTVVRKVQELLS